MMVLVQERKRDTAHDAVGSSRAGGSHRRDAGRKIAQFVLWANFCVSNYLFGKDGTFMHSQAVLFSCGNAGCSDCGYGGSQSCTDFLCGISELAQLSVSILAGFVGFLDGVGDVLGFISGFVNAFVGFFRSGSVGTKVTLDAVQSRLRIVQLYLPALGAAAVLTKGLGGIGKGRTERFVFLFLLVAISLFRTSLRAVSASVDLSFLSNW